MVTTNPLTLIGESSSPNVKDAAEMVRTSLKIPQTESVTTLVRLSSANSAATIMKAKHPGNSSIISPKKVPFAVVRFEIPAASEAGPSIGNAKMMRAKNIVGVRKNMLAKGLLVAGFLKSKIWVKLHLKPEQNEALITRANPRALKAVSPATIMITPAVMRRMMPHRRQVGFSRRKMKAKSKTNASTEDLHMVKKVREMNLNEKLPKPMSRAVAVPQGVIRVR